ncbi:glycosyltransferase family 61 protein [Methylobacterium sp. Leaf85]|uniref:glycosyltransferase family 61 protein n=1 Tax=Methylobacterium sp. Leaf85 TaxID=1736241 RepID=UPI000B274347|nr:glycosyltransferase 61 family protein [Methylobacterium sp. Leaf85]
MSTVKIKNQLNTKAALAALDRRDWKGVLHHSGDASVLLKSHRILMAYICAATEERDNKALDLAGEVASHPKWTLKQRYSFARNLVIAKHYASAWGAIIAFPDALLDPGLAKHARRILAYSKDHKLNTDIHKAVNRSTKGGSRIKAAISATDFPHPDAYVRKMGSTSVEASSRTPRHHIDIFNKTMEWAKSCFLKPAPPLLKEHRDVFVDRFGQIWKENGAVITSAGRSIPSLKRTDVPIVQKGMYGIKYTKGIYHWIVDRLTFFSWMTDGSGEDTQILLSDHAKSFERVSLEIAGLGNQIVEVGDAVFVEHLLKARVGFEGMMYWDRISSIIDIVKNYSRGEAIKNGLEPLEKIYISRTDATRRQMSNELELEGKLSALGYSVVSMSGIPLWQQIFIGLSAKDIIAPHGAGLSHILFCERDTRITEIIPIAEGTHKLRFNYARMSLALGHRYGAWLEPQVGDRDTWSTDIPEFLNFLERQAP